MKSMAVNPIPVVRNNLPAWRQSLLRDKAKHLTALEKISADLRLLDELAKVLDIDLSGKLAPEVWDGDELAP